MVLGKWPVEGSDRETTTCSQCGTHITVRSLTAPCICPRCKATISPIDGQPWGTPRILPNTAVPEGVIAVVSDEEIRFQRFDFTDPEDAA